MTMPLPDPTPAEMSATDLADAWRASRADAADAYATWCAAPRDVRRLARAAFVAAADREAAAERAFLRHRAAA